MYIETSSPRQPSQNAVLLTTSPIPADSAARCLSFWYHMLGSSVGTLRVWYGTRSGTYNINRLQQLFQQPRKYLNLELTCSTVYLVNKAQILNNAAPILRHFIWGLTSMTLNIKYDLNDVV